LRIIFFDFFLVFLPEIEKDEDSHQKESQGNGVTRYVDFVDEVIPLKTKTTKVIAKTH
jgi:hypothetical protein